MDLPRPVTILEDDVKLVAKQRELAADMAKSPYYITPKYSIKDVERYSDGLQENGNKGQSLASQLSPFMKAYLPPELMDRPSTAVIRTGGALAGLKPLPAFDAKSLTALEDRERKSAETGGDKEKEKDKDDAGMMSDIEAEMEEEEQDDDYAVDHYDSAEESAGDDEPAAVF